MWFDLKQKIPMASQNACKLRSELKESSLPWKFRNNNRGSWIVSIQLFNCLDPMDFRVFHTYHCKDINCLWTCSSLEFVMEVKDWGKIFSKGNNIVVFSSERSAVAVGYLACFDEAPIIALARNQFRSASHALWLSWFFLTATREELCVGVR